jgi:zinc/manganese transport system substrate-binding protein
MKRLYLPLAAAAWIAVASPALAALNIFACEPEWGALAAELGGPDVTVFTATTARQDPHQIQARPALIARLRAADLVVCTGAELEIGWMPMLLRQGANPKVQPGQAGFFEAASFVTLSERPARLDRADGDVHAAGNPHVHTDPRRLGQIAAALSERLAALDPTAAPRHVERHRVFASAWRQAIVRWQAEAAPLKGVPVVVHHRDWTYLLDWLGMREVATIEPKPGVPPSSGHLARLVEEIPKSGARMILYAAYQQPRGADFVSEKTGVPAVMLPYTIGGSDAANSLTGLFDDTIRRLLAGLGPARGR